MSAARAPLAAQPLARSEPVLEYRQGAYGDWEHLLVDPNGWLLKRWLTRRLVEDHQYDAGGRLWASFYRAGFNGSRAIDPTREPVDGGRHKDLTDGQLDARNAYNAAVKALNHISSRLVVDVSILEHDAQTVERMYGWRKDYAMPRIREALDDLARHYGLL